MLSTATLTDAIFSDLTSGTETKASRGITECFAYRSTFVYRKPDDPERVMAGSVPRRARTPLMLVPAIGEWRSNTDTAMAGSWERAVRGSP
jgi:hypothetical protein